MNGWRLLLAAAAAGVFAPVALAHKLTVTTATADGRLTVAAVFGDDLPADESAVEVRAADGAVVAAGTTDADGRWACPLPPPGRYTVAVRAFGNHAREVELDVRPDAPPPSPNSAWVWKAVGVAAVLAAWVGVLLWLRRRRTTRPPSGEPSTVGG
jgi:hypothetical protein